MCGIVSHFFSSFFWGDDSSESPRQIQALRDVVTKVKREISEFETLRWLCLKRKGNLKSSEPVGTHVSFIFEGLQPIYWGFKAFMFHGFGVQGNSPKNEHLRRCCVFFFWGGGKRTIWLFFSNFLICEGFGRSEYRIFKTNLSQIQIWAHDVLKQCCNAAAGFKATLHEKSDTPP